MNIDEYKKLELKLWANVTKTLNCWEWNRGLGSHGYGQVYLRRGKPLLAHRVSWEITNGQIPKGLYVLHKCDNKKCVRPDHLFIGTQKDNIRDMFKKGRANTRQARGDNNPNIKISDAQVKEIKEKYIGGTRQNPGNALLLAKEYGITRNLVYQIKNGKARCLV